MLPINLYSKCNRNQLDVTAKISNQLLIECVEYNVRNAAMLFSPFIVSRPTERAIRAFLQIIMGAAVVVLMHLESTVPKLTLLMATKVRHESQIDLILCATRVSL